MRITSYAPPTRNLAIAILVLVVLFVLYVLAAGVWIVPGSLTAVSGLVDRLQPTCRAGQVVATYGCQSERTSSSCPSGTCYRVWVETAVGCNPSAASSSSSSSANGTTVTMALYTQCHFALGASIPHLLYDPRAEAELVEWYATNETARAWRRGDCTFTCKAFEASAKELLVKNALLWAMDVTRNAPAPLTHTHTPHRCQKRQPSSSSWVALQSSWASSSQACSSCCSAWWYGHVGCEGAATCATTQRDLSRPLQFEVEAMSRMW